MGGKWESSGCEAKWILASLKKCCEEQHLRDGFSKSGVKSYRLIQNTCNVSTLHSNYTALAQHGGTLGQMARPLFESIQVTVVVKQILKHKVQKG